MGVSSVIVIAVASDMTVAIVVLLGIAAVLLLGRIAPASRRRRRSRPVLFGEPWGSDVTVTPAHPPRHTGARRPRAGDPACDTALQLRQLERLHALGHISDEDVERLRESLGCHAPTDDGAR